MPVLLTTSRALPADADYDVWCSVAGAARRPGPSPRMEGFETVLLQAYDAIGEDFRALAKRLGEEPSAGLAHAPAAAANVSDLGLMLAWTRLVREWEPGPRRVLVVCDDPWLFRHLAGLGARPLAKPPALLSVEARLLLRGLAARTRAAAVSLLAWWRLRGHKKAFPKGAASLLVYGHPDSSADGRDAYFGSTMDELPGLRRVLHVDCPRARAAELAAGGRTFSLHGWGGPRAALAMPLARWRPAAAHLRGELGWIVRRAAALEGGTGQAAALRWQTACQEAWLESARPRVVAWPWENYSWERAFVRAARGLGVRTVGYQHSIVGRHEWNYAPASNPDGEASLPDRILASGPAGQRQLAAFGVPRRRLAIGGALRMKAFTELPHDPKGPVFVALHSNRAVIGELVEALRPLGEKGWRFHVKEHPMYPLGLAESPGVSLSRTPLSEEQGLAGVIYVATTVGLESLFGGLPTLRYLPRDSIAPEIVPDGMEIPAVTADGLERTLGALKRPGRTDPTAVFSPPDKALWRSLLGAEGEGG